MGSTGNPNPWAPYNTYKDCSLGICSIYCPQWCYLIFPPPPPPSSNEDGSGPYFSPLVIAVIGILASAFLLVSYYTIIKKYCRRRRNDRDFGDPNRDQMDNESWQNCTNGLDESFIKSITVCKYKKGDGLVEGTDCSVCLSEFQEDENLRLLPKCNHAFHLPCIDTWLKSHSSCPLCRSNIASVPPANLPTQQPPPPNRQETSPHGNRIAPVQPHRIEGTPAIQDVSETSAQNDTVVSIISNDASPRRIPTHVPEKSEASLSEIAQDDDVQGMRRSASLNSGLCHDPSAIAGSSKIGQDECDAHQNHHQIQVEISRFSIEVGSSRPYDDGEDSRINEFSRHSNSETSPPARKRSISTGKLVFGRGRDLINSNTNHC